ncbi:MAG: hypothetical protein IPL49_11045 [Saprospirales bacterium]|nr:hypothetical protein [Saprospirales bacterium]
MSSLDFIYSYPLFITVWIILKPPVWLDKIGRMSRYYDRLSRQQEFGFPVDHDLRLAVDDLSKGVKGVVFSVNPSPLSNDITLMFPVDFFRMVLMTTEFGRYSIISIVYVLLIFQVRWYP